MNPEIINLEGTAKNDDEISFWLLQKKKFVVTIEAFVKQKDGKKYPKGE